MSDQEANTKFSGTVGASFDRSLQTVRAGIKEVGHEVEVKFNGKVDESLTSTLESITKGLEGATEAYEKLVEAAEKHAKSHAAAKGGKSEEEESPGKKMLKTLSEKALNGVIPGAAEAIKKYSEMTGSVRVLNIGLDLLGKAGEAASEGLEKFAKLEELTDKLNGVAGGAEAARQKIGELAETFHGTPVEVPDAVEAYRNANAADRGSGELSGTRGLTLLGDVAAESGNAIQETATAVGQLYNDLLDGAPIDKSADKLREMGIISGHTREQLDRLLASGMSGSSVWDTLREEFEHSAGAMKEAQNNLSNLQKSVEEAKSKLYESFGKGSLESEKNKLKTQGYVLGKLQPVAEEAGDVYGTVKNLPFAVGKSVVQATVGKEGLDKAFSNPTVIKTLTDAVVALGAAVVLVAGYMLLATPAMAALTAAASIAAGGLLAIGGVVTVFGGIAVAAVAAAGGLALYTYQLSKAYDAQVAYLQQGQNTLDGLEKQRGGIVSVADKIKFLGDAYGELHKAREGVDNAKGTQAKTVARTVMQQIETVITEEQSGRNVLPNKVKRLEGERDTPGMTEAGRAKRQKEIDETQERIRHGERGGFADLEQSQHSKDLDKQYAALSAPKGDADVAKAAREEAEEAANTAAIKKKAFEDLDAEGAGPTQRAETKKNKALRKDAGVAEREAKKADKEAEQIQQAATEFGGSAESDPEYINAQEKSKKLRAEAKEKREQAEKSEAHQQNLPALTESASDAAKEARNNSFAAKQKADQLDGQARISAKEADAQTQRDALGSEGIQRARDEYEINRQVLELKLREAQAQGDTNQLRALGVEYYHQQVALAKEEAAVAKSVRDDTQGLQDDKDARKDAADKRQFERDFKSGKITDDERRKGEAGLLENERKRTAARADQKDKDADERTAKGDIDGGLRLKREAEGLRGKVDELGDQETDLLNPDKPKDVKPERKAPIVDELRKIGGGGGAYYGREKDPSAKIDETNRLLKENNTLTKEGNNKQNLGRVL